MAALCLILVASGVSAEVEGSDTVAVQPDFSGEATRTGTLSGNHAAGLRQQIDQAGNRDGRASDKEVRAYEEKFRADFNRAAQKDGPGASLANDGVGVAGYRLTAFDLASAEGLVTNDGSIGLNAQYRFDLPLSSGPQLHELRWGEAGPEAGVIRSTTLTLPDDWNVLHIHDPSARIVHREGNTFTLAGELRSANVSVDYSFGPETSLQAAGAEQDPSSKRDVPSVPIVVVIATTLGSALFRRPPMRLSATPPWTRRQ